MAVSPNQFAAQLDSLIADIPTIINDAMELALNEAEGLVEERIFNKNVDITGASFGDYSKAYKRKRKKAGLQVGVIDFQFKGDLKKDVVQNISRDGWALLLNSTLSEKKARGNEKRKGKKIFEISNEEADKCVKIVEDYFIQKVVDGI